MQQIANLGWGNHRRLAGLPTDKAFRDSLYDEDCFVYACARHLGQALLFKGGDLAQTDIQAA